MKRDETLEQKIRRLAAGNVDELVQFVVEITRNKNAAYVERNRLVAFVSKLYPSHLARHSAAEWEDDWRTIVCIHGPRGQMTWHLHKSEVKYFNHLKMGEDHWDNHTTPQKYQRLLRINPNKKR